MSLAETAAKAKAYGMSYGQYYLARDMGTLPPEPKREVEPPAPQARFTASGAFRWSKELTDYVIAMHDNGMKPKEISRRTGIPIQKIYNKLKELRRNEQI